MTIMKKWNDEGYGKKCDHITDQNDMLIMYLRDMNHIMRSLYEGKGSQKRILIMLLEQGGMTQKSLTERLGIQPGSASEVLMKLERGNLITRTESPQDRRTIDIGLTEQGKMVAEEATDQRRKRHEEMFSCLSQEEVGTLLGLLEKVNASWQERYGNIEEGHKGRHGHFHGHDRGKNRHFHEHGKDGGKKCDGNCQACEHPCRRR